MKTLLLFVIALGQEPAPEPFVARHVALDVTVDYAAPRLHGSIVYSLQNWTGRPARSVSFILHRLMDVSAVHDSVGHPLRFSQRVVRFSDDPMRQVTQVKIMLPRAIPAGGGTSIRLDYGGYLTGYTEIGWLYVKDHIDTAFTIIRSDALAFPIVGGVSDAANRRRPYRDFSYEADVTVPSRFVVATGGVATRTVHADGTTWRYVSSGQSPFLNIAIAPFDTLTVDGIHVFYFREDSVGARRLLAGAETGLRTLAQWFGPRRDATNLTIIEIPDGWGSQANAVGGIIQTAAAFRDTTNVSELYHELSHLWNVNAADNPSPRWNEGLATFLEALMYEKLNGWTGRPQYYQRRVQRLRAALATDSSLRNVPFIDYGTRSMTDQSYRVGDLMFATIYELIGPDRFNQIIGGYYRKFTMGGTTQDFLVFASAQAPELKSLFDDWMLSTGWTARLTSDSVTPASLAAPYRR